MDWNKIKIEAISIAQTFGVTFIVTLAGLITTTGTVEWSASFWLALITAAGRAAVKVIIAQFLPTHLGGVKQV